MQRHWWQNHYKMTRALVEKVMAKGVPFIYFMCAFRSWHVKTTSSNAFLAEVCGCTRQQTLLAGGTCNICVLLEHIMVYDTLNVVGVL